MPQGVSFWASLGNWLCSAASWLVPSVLTILGWLAIYIIQLCSQRKAFLLQTREGAWRELHKAILDYQKLLSADLGNINFVHAFLVGRPAPNRASAAAMNCARTWSETLQSDASTDWTFLMEHFEVLFSETAKIRLQLLNIERLIREDIYASRREMFGQSHEQDATIGMLEKAMEPALKRLPLLGDQIALLQDLLIHLQNTVFSNLTSYSLSPRQPVSQFAIRLGFAASDRKRGILHIIDGYGALHDAAISRQSASLVEPDWLSKDPPSC